ncbi:MAG: hypothetical protein JWM93_3265, partial [Frankiales bacterium]|nr:hypothetical protein [Frankiales bacterium]
MSESRTTIVGLGGAAAFDSDFVLDIAPQHPSAHGALRLALTLDGDRITAAEPLVGYMHRGAEKLFEVRDYRQILVLTNRHDWLSAFSNELGLVLALERMMGIEVPVRAVWLRTLLAEINRILSHLAFLGNLPGGSIATAAERDTLQLALEELAGGRVHFMFNRIGGLKDDLPAGWRDRCRTALGVVRELLPSLEAQLEEPSFVARTRGVGFLHPSLVGGYGLSGPIARASGAPLDLRVDEPYLAYGALVAAGALRVVTRDAGDCLARFEVLAEQVAVSLDLADACLDELASLPAGPVNVRLPKVVRAPEGETYCWTENPLGI